jgi:WXXGXW repeat (2 copies)
MRTAVRLLVLSIAVLVLTHGAWAQVISVSFGPPALPVYEQPVLPQDGYLWVPGYWAFDNEDGYYWVPGTWVEPPQEGYLWTPGWWGWDNDAYMFHEGYWGPEVGWYGGINYGYGYSGYGYDGGRWDHGHFAYNTYVNRVNTEVIHNTYNARPERVSESHVSYNGGQGGVEARPTAQQEAYERQRHVGPVAAQTQHVQAARGNPELRASANHGKPPIAATVKPTDFKTGAVASRAAGGEYKAPPANAQRGGEAKPAAENRPQAKPEPQRENEAKPSPSAENRPQSKPEPQRENEAKPTAENHPAEAPAPKPAEAPAPKNHASELQAHTYTPPNTGNAKTDQKYQQQQQKLAAQQAKDHQKLQQQQEKQHQQAAKQNYDDARKQQMEQQHAQQTQQLEAKHATQQKQMEQKQAPQAAHAQPHPAEPHEPATRPEEKGH